MIAKIIDGKALSEKILLNLRQQIIKMKKPPGLGAILVGDDPASHLYVSTKKKACIKVGINFYDYLCGGKNHPSETEKDVIKVIEFLNNDDSVDGVIIQLPLPENFDTKTLIDKINPAKDVDGFLPQSATDFKEGKNIITPPLIKAVNHAIESTGEDLTDKQAVIISNSPIFSDPMKQDLEQKGLIVKTVSPNENYKKITTQADILITIVGKPHFIKPEAVKPEAIVIDIGTTLVGEKKWAGDVDPAVKKIAGHITPVPGGIGPLTVAMLLKNTYELAVANQEKKS